MSVKEKVRQQYIRISDQAAEQVKDLSVPSEGWITTMRKALQMSVTQLAERAGISRAAIYKAQRNELNGVISLQQMEKLAEAMGGKFVYAIVPNERIDDIIKRQAGKKAKNLVQRASAHMALESQSLSLEQNRQEIEQLAKELMREQPSDFWDAR